MLFGHKKEWSTATCYNLDQPRKCAKRKKSDTKVSYWMNPSVWKVQNREIPRDRMEVGGLQGRGVGGMGSDCSWAQGLLLGWWECFRTRPSRWLHSCVNGLNTTELYSLKCLKWLISCYVNFIFIIKRKKKKRWSVKYGGGVFNLSPTTLFLHVLLLP